MADIVYPYGGLPSPHFTSSGVKQVPSLLVSDMESGRSRVRRVFKNVPSVLSIQWRLTDGEAAFFGGWLEHYLGGGLFPFLLNIRLPAGLESHEVRLLTHPNDDLKLSGGKWVYTAKVEVKVVPVISKELTDLLQQHKLRGLEKAAKISSEIEL